MPRQSQIVAEHRPTPQVKASTIAASRSQGNRVPGATLKRWCKGRVAKMILHHFEPSNEAKILATLERDRISPEGNLRTTPMKRPPA